MISAPVCGRLARAVVSLVLSFALAITTPACTRPLPGPDGGVAQPSGVVATLDSIATTLDVLLPLIRPLLLRQVPDGDAKTAVLASLTGFEAASSAWQSGHLTWDARGGDRCVAYALSGALTDATRSLVRDLGRAGTGWGPDLEALLTSLGRLADRILGACPTTDGGMLASSGRTGDAVRAFLAEVEAEARARGRSLTPLPSVRR